MEWLGNEAYAYIPFEAPPEVQEQLTQLERDLDGESLRTQLVISLDGASRIAEGDEAEIWVDASKMHLFDPDTGENLTVDRSKRRIRMPGGSEEVGREQALPERRLRLVASGWRGDRRRGPGAYAPATSRSFRHLRRRMRPCG